MQKLTERGIGLARRFRSLGIATIESYPGAAQDIMGIPRKRASMELLSLGLQRFGLSGDFATLKVSHDELDAITSAVVGGFFWSGHFEALGSENEEYLIIPDLSLDQRRWSSRVVIGLSGPISVGKTTAARMLERRGFEYRRYSQVIAKIARDRGLIPSRSTLQELGNEIHNTYGQRWLGRKLVDGLNDDCHVVIDGLRHPEDHAFLTEMFGPQFIHVALRAPRDVRCGRALAQGVPKPLFEAALTHAVESNVEKLQDLADETFENLGSLIDLELQIDQTLLRRSITTEELACR
jgi:dephospho-CoA kinase